MAFKVDHINLTAIDTTPAYDMGSDGHFLAFRTDRIPGCRFNGKAVIVVYDNYEVHFYDEADNWVRYSFTCTPQEYAYMCALYMAPSLPQ